MARSSAPAGGQRHGTVRSFHGGRGYGFIDAGTGADLFVHRTNLLASRPLEAGELVQFHVRAGRKGPEAYDVAGVWRPLHTGPVSAAT